MIKETIVQEVVEKEIAGSAIFLVEVNVSADNRIRVVIDSMQKITIENCSQLSRVIEQHLDRDREDFELQVSSAGIGKPFKVKQQYIKNIGKEVEVLTVDGIKNKGKLLSVKKSGIEIEIQEMPGKGNQKRKNPITVRTIDFQQIKSTRDIVIF